MKVSKRSLIVSIAVLCVCALSLTAASFAWFSASQTAAVKDIRLQVNAQSDIKLSAVEEATLNSTSSAWLSTLVQTNFGGENRIETDIADATPTAEIFNGEFKTLTATARERIDSDSGDVLTGEEALEESDYMNVANEKAGYYSDFTVYVRATELKDIVISFTDFKYVVKQDNAYTDAPNGAVSAVEALRLGYVGSKLDSDGQPVLISNVLSGNENNKIVIDKSALKAFDNGDGFYSEVKFYVWVEGTDGACATKNALSLKDYQFSINFAYAE